MEPEYSVITKEITAKGKGYLVIRKCPPDKLSDTVRRGARELLEAGASLLYAASADPAAPLAEGIWGNCRLSFCHDMLRMERALDKSIAGADEIVLEGLCREKWGQWLTLYNEGFFHVPNSATYDHKDLVRCMEESSRCGFAVAKGVAVGVYELNLQGECPEIEGIALVKSARGKGLGRALLRACMAELAGLGYNSCCLRMSTANEAALRLYQEEGFFQTDVVGRWYQILAQGDLMQ